VNIPYDIDNPPAEPPPGVSPLLWKVAFALRGEHDEGPDGWCLATSCRRASALWPCEKRKLSDVGLMGTVGGGVQPPPTNPHHPPARTTVIRPYRNQR
jgi:hypothetical protein